MKPQLGSGGLFPRRKTIPVHVGGVMIGGGAPVIVQSMTNTDTRDVDATVNQIKRMEAVGCEIVRIAVPDQAAVEALSIIKSRIGIPLIADIHFDHRIAIAAVEKGVDALRINPGNIGSAAQVGEVVRAAQEHSLPIRIGVNAGSLEKDLLEKYDGATPEAMVESAMRHVRILESLNFSSIKISLKASDIFRTLKASRLLSEKVEYPFHAGITESGTLLAGSVRSSSGLTLLLEQGLADTIRVSLTAPPEVEVRVAFLLLAGLGLREYGPQIVSCPVCGRCEVDLTGIASEIEERLAIVKNPVSLAIMGCMVNGPGEAKEADLGVACGRGVGVIFKKGKLLRKVRESKIVEEFVKEVMAFIMSNDDNKESP